jgi:hypothetical protein
LPEAADESADGRGEQQAGRGATVMVALLVEEYFGMTVGQTFKSWPVMEARAEFDAARA